MQVRHDEGVATHIGLEPCAVVRKDGGEASVGEHTGQPLSLAKIYIPGADAVANAEGNTVGCVIASNAMLDAEADRAARRAVDRVYSCVRTVEIDCRRVTCVLTVGHYVGNAAHAR